MALTPRTKARETPPVSEADATAEAKAYEKKKEVAASFDVEKKIKEIEASKLPESEKKAYIARLTGNKSDPAAVNRVPFTVWANRRNIRQNIRVGMLAFPKAKGVANATFEEWDTIFKDF